MASLQLDIALRRRAFTLELTLRLEGETVALVGPSGAGKSTVLEAVAGLVRPDIGRIALDNTTWFDSTRNIDRPPEHRQIGYLFQGYALFPHLTVYENVAYAQKQSANHLLERFGMAHLARAYPGHLSGGERQRTALVRALASEPQVLLLDEPFAALDAQTRRSVRSEFLAVLRELQLPCIVVTHDFEDAAGLADRVATISDGKLGEFGPVREVVTRPASRLVAELTGANIVSGTARPTPSGRTEVRLVTGGTIELDRPAAGEIRLAIYPWQLSVTRPNSTAAAAPGIVGPISAIMARGGDRAYIQVGELVAEITINDLDRLQLGEGDRVVISCDPRAITVVTDGDSSGKRDQDRDESTR